MPTGGHSRENGSARQAQGQVTGRTSGHMPLAAPQLSTLGPPTWGRPILGQLGLQSTQETSGVLWYSPSPPTVISVLGQPFPPNHQNLPRLAATALPTISHHRKPQGSNPALPTEVLLPWYPSPFLLRRKPYLHTGGFSGAMQPPWACLPGRSRPGYLPTQRAQRAMDTTTQPLPRLSSPIHFSPSLPHPSVLGSALDSEPRHKCCQHPQGGTRPWQPLGTGAR